MCVGGRFLVKLGMSMEFCLVFMSSLLSPIGIFIPVLTAARSLFIITMLCFLVIFLCLPFYLSLLLASLYLYYYFSNLPIQCGMQRDQRSRGFFSE